MACRAGGRGADDGDVHLVVCAGAALTGPPKGASYDRGDALTGAPDADGIVVTAEKLAEANAPENLSRYRVAVLEEIDPDDPVEVAFLAAIMRHELEHCRQWEAGSQASELYGLVDTIIGLVCGDDEERWSELINIQPIEGDANAASSAYLRRRYQDAIPALAAGDDHFLADWAGQVLRETPGNSLSARLSSCTSLRMSATTQRAGRRTSRSPTSSTGGCLVAAISGGGSMLAPEQPIGSGALVVKALAR